MKELPLAVVHGGWLAYAAVAAGASLAVALVVAMRARRSRALARAELAGLAARISLGVSGFWTGHYCGGGVVTRRCAAGLPPETFVDRPAPSLELANRDRVALTGPLRVLLGARLDRGAPALQPGDWTIARAREGGGFDLFARVPVAVTARGRGVLLCQWLGFALATFLALTALGRHLLAESTEPGWSRFALAAALPTTRAQALERIEAVLATERLRSPRAARQYVELAALRHGCSGELPALMQDHRYDDAARRGRECGDATTTAVALVANGHYDAVTAEIARGVPPSIVLPALIATAQWARAALGADRLANTAGNSKKSTARYRCLGVLFRHFAGDRDATQRLTLGPGRACAGVLGRESEAERAALRWAIYDANGVARTEAQQQEDLSTARSAVFRGLSPAIPLGLDVGDAGAARLRRRAAFDTPEKLVALTLSQRYD